jgi:hypothetical protein
MKPTLEERIMATGQTLEKVREWQSIIESIAAKSGEPKEDVSSIILRPLASGKVILDDCYKLQEIGVSLSESFMKLVPPGEATSKALLHELTRLGHNSAKAKKDLAAAWDYGVKLATGQMPDRETHTEETGNTTGEPTMPISNKLEIYPNAVLIDGKPVRVRKHGVHIQNYADRGGHMTVSLELMPESVTLYSEPFEEKGGN